MPIYIYIYCGFAVSLSYLQMWDVGIHGNRLTHVELS